MGSPKLMPFQVTGRFAQKPVPPWDDSTGTIRAKKSNGTVRAKKLGRFAQNQI